MTNIAKLHIKVEDIGAGDIGEDDIPGVLILKPANQPKVASRNLSPLNSPILKGRTRSIQIAERHLILIGLCN